MLISLDNGNPVPLTPRWIVEPYADRAACWGCGLAPAGEPHSLTGLRLYSWPGLMF